MREGEREEGCAYVLVCVCASVRVHADTMDKLRRFWYLPLYYTHTQMSRVKAHKAEILCCAHMFLPGSSSYYPNGVLLTAGNVSVCLCLYDCVCVCVCMCVSTCVYVYVCGMYVVDMHVKYLSTRCICGTV